MGFKKATFKSGINKLGINDQLEKWQNKFNNYIDNCIRDVRHPDIDEAVSFTLSDKLSYKLTFAELAAHYIFNSRLKHQSIKKYNSLIHDFELYEKENHTKIYVSEINSNLFEKLGKWMSACQHNVNSTINRKFKTINAMMNYGVEKGLMTSKQYSKINMLEEIKETDRSLTEQELNILKAYPRNEYLDIFLFSCETGLRISDLKQIADRYFKRYSQDQPWIGNCTRYTSI